VIRFSSVPCQDRLDLPQLTCLQVSLDLAQVIDAGDHAHNVGHILFPLLVHAVVLPQFTRD
jgi:hypothetical protein